MIVDPHPEGMLKHTMAFSPHNTSRDRIKHFIAGQKTTVAGVLQTHFRLTPERVTELFGLGAVYSDKKRIFEDRTLEKGGYLRIHLEPKRFPASQIDWKSTILSDEKDFLVFLKPSGIPVHATVDNSLDNALHQLRVHTKTDLLVTNRLDIPVSGVMLFAKNPSFQKRFNQWLLERKVIKFYRALVPGTPPLGRHIHYMEPGPRAPKIVSLEARKDWQKCELTIHEAIPYGELSDVKIELHTGRTHQIRSQLAFMGFPLQGDRLYGSRLKYEAQCFGETIALFSNELSFPNYGKAPWHFKKAPHWVH